MNNMTHESGFSPGGATDTDGGALGSPGEEFEYEYDLSDALSYFNYYELIPTAIVYGFTLIAGLIGKLICSAPSFSRLIAQTTSSINQSID